MDGAKTAFAQSAENLVRHLRGDTDSGLSASEAQSRFELHGHNSLHRETRKSLLAILGNQLQSLSVGLAAPAIEGGHLPGSDPFAMVQTGVALALGPLPEGLPIVATLNLARGIWRMTGRSGRGHCRCPPGSSAFTEVNAAARAPCDPSSCCAGECPRRRIETKEANHVYAQGHRGSR